MLLSIPRIVLIQVRFVYKTNPVRSAGNQTEPSFLPSFLPPVLFSFRSLTHRSLTLRMECHRLKIVVSYHNVSRHIVNLKLKPMSVGLLALLLLQIKCLVGGYRLSPNSSVKKLLASSIMHVPLKCSVSYGENNFGGSTT